MCNLSVDLNLILIFAKVTIILMVQRKLSRIDFVEKEEEKKGVYVPFAWEMSA